MSHSLIKYIVPFRALKDGVHEFTFDVDKAFLTYFSETDLDAVNTKVKLTIHKKTLVTTFRFELKGVITTVCDRCLDTVTVEIKGENTLFLKFGSEHEELAENVIVLSESENEINVAQYIYELFMLSLPLKYIHADDVEGNSTCNQEMIEKLESYSVQPEEESDPRWAELKKLINNN